MGSHFAARTSTARLLVGLVMVAIVAACSGTTASTAPPTPPSSPSATAASSAPSTSASASPDAQAQIAALKAKLNGKKVIIGTSSFPNASITGAFKTVDFLKSDFGLDVDFKLLDSDPLVAALISNQVDIGQLSLAGQASAVSAGADLIGFGGDDQKNTFVVASKSSITDMSQLKGKPFGVTQNLTQITGQTARKCLSTAGLDIEKDVQLLKLSNTSETTTAIKTGQVAGAISATFRLTPLYLAEGQNAYTVLCKGWEANPQISSIWMGTKDWLAKNEDVALALNIASLESARWAKANKDAWIALAQQTIDGYTKEAGEIDYQTLVVDLGNWPVNGSLDRALCDSTLATSFEFGVTDRAYTTDELVTFKYQDQAVQILGQQ